MEQSSGQPPPKSENDDISFFYQLEPDINSLDQYFIAAQITEEHPTLLRSLNLPHASYLPLDPPTASSEFGDATPGLPFGSSVSTVTSGLVTADQEPSGFLPVGNSLFVPQNDMKNLFVPHDLLAWSCDEYTCSILDFQRQEMRSNMGVSRPAVAAAASSSTPEHVMAERKRRERLNQQFVALSSIIPGLKKTDKATLLGGAIGYIRQLEQKVKTLEEKASERTVEPSILKKSNPSATHIDSASNSGQASFPKITASMNGSCILVRIQCEKRKGLFVKVLSVMENHHLSVINTNVMPFASSCVNITVAAQIEEGFATAMKDLVKDIDSALSQSMKEEIRI